MKLTNLYHAILRVASFALPISAGSIVNSLVGFISMMMVAHLSQKELAAGALAITTFMTVMTVTSTIFYSVSILISFKKRENNFAEMGLIVKNSIWIAFLLAIPAGFALWHADTLLGFFGQDPQLIAFARGYFHFSAMSLFPLLVGAIMMQFFSGIGRPRMSLYLSLIYMPLTILAAYGFVLGHFGFPQLGLAGVACATLIVNTAVVIGLLIYVNLQKKMHAYSLFNKPFLPTWSVCKSICTLGLPIGLQFGGEFLALSCSTYLMGLFGVTALAASQIVGQYYMLLIIPLIGLSQALSVLVSEAFAKNHRESIKENVYAAITIFLIFAILVAIAFAFFPGVLMKFYIHDRIINYQLVHLVSLFFIVSMVLYFSDGLRHLLSGALRGMHDSQGPMRINVLSLWLMSLPLAYIVGFIFSGGPVGLRIGFLSGFIFSAIVLSFRLKNKLKAIQN